MFPGTAKTSLPCSRARSAVIREPLFSAASTTTTPSESPAATRLRSRKKWRNCSFAGGFFLGDLFDDFVQRDSAGVVLFVSDRGAGNEINSGVGAFRLEVLDAQLVRVAVLFRGGAGLQQAVKPVVERDNVKLVLRKQNVEIAHVVGCFTHADPSYRHGLLHRYS